MSFWKSLFKKKEPIPQPEEIKDSGAYKPSLSIKLPPEEEKEFPELMEPRPSPKGKSRAQFNAEIRRKHKASFNLDKKRAVSIGSTGYIWRSCGDGDVCAICRENDGKEFGWNSPPEHGHPGHASCKGVGYCRCYAETIIPD